MSYCQKLKFQKSLTDYLVRTNGDSFQILPEARIIDEALAAAGLDRDNTAVVRIEDKDYIHIQFRPKH